MSSFQRFISACATALIVALGIVAPCSAEASRPPPELEHSGGQYRLLVDGQPFLILGGQVHNSSASKAEDLEPAWKSLAALHANTAEVPLYWELLEPEPGKFDFHLIDQIVAGARRHGLRLVFLWFASWKNGESHYAPEWVKRDEQKFPRVTGPRGEKTAILSPLSAAARDADSRAFAAVTQHIRSIDEADRTVIMMQVENEAGLLGTDRDYSPGATRLFGGPVPGELMAYLEAHRDALTASLRAAWSQASFRRSGTWTEVFGEMAPEVFSAWHVAGYVEAVAAAGKLAYPLPIYANVWLINPGDERAGRWPSGGPTEHVLDVWKAAAPHLDLVGVDIYQPEFRRICTEYTRPDNPLFVPEVRFSAHYAANAFLTFATFNGLGFSPFGIDNALEGDSLRPDASEFEDSYRVLQPLLPLVARYRYTGKLHAIVQGENWAQVIHLSERLAAVVRFSKPYSPEGARGRGMLIELAPDDFVVAGAGFSVSFRELQGPPREAEILSLDEGTFEGERWVPSRRLNGDELHVRFAEKARILRVRLLP